MYIYYIYSIYTTARSARRLRCCHGPGPSCLGPVPYLGVQTRVSLNLRRKKLLRGPVSKKKMARPARSRSGSDSCVDNLRSR